MLYVNVKAFEMYDESADVFYNIEDTYLEMEHSLEAISKWESKYEKPFFNNEFTNDEFLYYIKCMTINTVPEIVFSGLTDNNIKKINTYITTKHTATVVNKRIQNSNNSGEMVTSELIYYWMVALQIPFECERWNINRLMTLIDICNVKNEPSQKMSNKDVMSQNRQLNAMRRAKYNSKG